MQEDATFVASSFTLYRQNSLRLSLSLLYAIARADDEE